VKSIAEAGFDPEFGARPVKRVIQRNVLNQLSKELLAGTVDKTQPIVVDATPWKDLIPELNPFPSIEIVNVVPSLCYFQSEGIF